MIKRKILSINIIGFLLLTSFCVFKNAAYGVAPSMHPIQACFTPGQNCTAQIIQVLDTAKKTIFVQAYSFTSAPIARHLVEAKNRGVTVEVILDKSQTSQSSYSASRFLLHQHIPIWIDYKPAIAHNKIIIIDGERVITGSFNFTKAAQNKNAENLLIIQDSALAEIYTKNWRKRKAVSEAMNYSSSFQQPRSKPKRSWFTLNFLQ